MPPKTPDPERRKISKFFVEADNAAEKKRKKNLSLLRSPITFQKFIFISDPKLGMLSGSATTWSRRPSSWGSKPE